MKKCIQKLSTNLVLLMDGFFIKDIPGFSNDNQRAIVYGDSISISIAAASILAKVHRDTIMSEFAKMYPQYGFEIHKGYGTNLHRKTLIEFGPCDIHRTAYITKTLTKSYSIAKKYSFDTIK